MIVLVSGSTATMRAIGNVQNLGVFFNPKSSNYSRQIVQPGMPWAADNAAFKSFNATAFELMLDKLAHRKIPNCLFVTVPDKVGDCTQTCKLFYAWQPRIAAYRWPLAFVAQDGLIARDAPWNLFDVLFVGGSTRWKMGIQAYTLCAYAKALGKSVHVGRVNSPMRAEIFSDVADSIDGTATSRYGRIFIPRMIEAARLGNRFGPSTPQRELF